jgi:hypothetical protein
MPRNHYGSWCIMVFWHQSGTKHNGKGLVCLLSFHSGNSAKHCASGGYAAGLTSTRRFGGTTYG